MRFLRVSLPIVAAALLGACYHATIETGLPPSPQVIDQGFASGWIYGLVPPKTVTTASKCPSGVAKVETELSFVNQLVSFLTLGIYTPMHIRVTCAAGPSASARSKVSIQSGADTVAVQRGFAIAAEQAAREHLPVLVQFQH
ncbi:MAG TPA: Bor family protein [Gemmatimonadales bacterium]|nr:Bor family protein [Gemmatimonadales bacterium]